VLSIITTILRVYFPGNHLSAHFRYTLKVLLLALSEFSVPTEASDLNVLY
jgi:hypothetical protein